MTAQIVKTGGPDTGHVSAVCNAPECADINGRPWSHMYSRRSVEGYRLAERDTDAHNRAQHPKGPDTMADLITATIAAAVRDDAGRLEYIDLRIETPLRLTTAADLALSIAAHLLEVDAAALRRLEVEVEELRGHDGGANLYFCTLSTEPKE